MKGRVAKTAEQLEKERYVRLMEEELEQKELNALAEKERAKALDCMFKVMNHQLDGIKAQTKEAAKMQKKHAAELDDFDEKLNRKENDIFRKYHEERIRRKKYEIE